MIKVVEIHDNERMVSFPVEADANWTQEAFKLAHLPPLFIKLVNIRDVRPDDDLDEMLALQWSRYTDFASNSDTRHLVKDCEFDEAIKLYDKTWGAIDG